VHTELRLLFRNVLLFSYVELVGGFIHELVLFIIDLIPAHAPTGNNVPGLS